MSEDIVGLAHGMIAAVKEKGNVATGWRMSPKVAVRVADYYGIQVVIPEDLTDFLVVIPEDLTDFLGLPVQVDATCGGIALLSERPGIRVAHNNPISDTPERILLDLIAELVGDDGDGHELTGDDKHGCQVCAAIDRAEARLREVTGDE